MLRNEINDNKIQFSSVAQSCLTLCDPMNRSMPALPVHHQLLEFTQTHFDWVSDATQPSQPQSSPSPPAPNPSQHQSLFQWVNSSHDVAKVLELQLWYHSFQRNPRADLLQNGLVGSPCSPRDSQESSPTPQFKSFNSLVLSFLHNPTLTSIHDHWKHPIALTRFSLALATLDLWVKYFLCYNPLHPCSTGMELYIFSILRVMKIKEKHFKGKCVFWLIDIYLGKEP